MQYTSQDGQSIGARLRMLGAPVPIVDESKLEVAATLARDLVAAASSSLPPSLDEPPLPVLAHYCRTLIEWTVSCILKSKPPPPQGAGKAQQRAPASASGGPQRQPEHVAAVPEDHLPRTLRLWSLLRLLLQGDPRVGGSPADAAAGSNSGGGGGVSRRSSAATTLALAGQAAGSISGALLVSAATCLRQAFSAAVSQAAGSVTTASAQPAEAGTLEGRAAAASSASASASSSPVPLAAQLAQSVLGCFEVLMGGGGGGGDPMRPSLEQLVTLLTALLDVRPRRNQHGGAGSGAQAAAAKRETVGTAPAAATAVVAPGDTDKKKGSKKGRKDRREEEEEAVADAPPDAFDGSQREQLVVWDAAPAVVVAWARLLVHVLHVTHGSVQGHPAPRKVWRAFVPELVLPLLEVSQPLEPLSATMQLVLGAQGGAVAAAAAATTKTGGVTAAPVTSGDDCGTAAAAAAELGRAAQQLLGAVLFQEAHVGALAELFAALLPGTDSSGAGGAGGAPATAAADGTAGGGATTEPAGTAPSAGGEAAGGGGGGGAVPEQRRLLLPGFGDHVGRCYHGQLLQVLATAAAADGGGGGGASGPGGAEADTVTVLGLPWLLRGYCRAVARLRRNLTSDAAVTAAATGGGKGQRRAAGESDGVPAAAAATGNDEDGGAAAGAPSHKALAAAEFNCMTVLSYMLLQPPPPPPQLPSGGGGVDVAAGRPAKRRKVVAAAAAAAAAAPSAPAPAAAAEVSSRGSPVLRLALAGVLAAGRAAGAYQPTRDLTGANRAVLAVIADRLLAAAAAAPPAPDAKPGKPSGGKEAAAAAAATSYGARGRSYGTLRSLSTSLALCAVLDLDHRVLTPHLERVWSLLWSTAGGDAAAGPSGGQIEDAGGGGHDGGSGGDGSAAASSAVTAAPAAAAAVLQRTLRAFSELRQLQSLLESLGRAMRAVCGGGGGGGSADCGVYGGVAAAGLLVRPEVVAALRQAVTSAPSGQFPALVSWVAADLQAWCEIAQVTRGSVAHVAAAAAVADLMLAAGTLYDTLLTALRLDLATASPVARANEQLLAALAAPLLSSVRQYCKSRRELAGRAVVDDASEVLAVQLHTARLAMLLRVYGAVGSHDGGYLAPVLIRGVAAAAPDGDAAGDAVQECRDLRKALKKAGSSDENSRAGLLPALAQLTLLPANGRLQQPPAAAAAAADPGGAPEGEAVVRAGGWAAVELSRAVHRCLGHRLQVLHERTLRRRHTCPLYGKAAAAAAAAEEEAQAAEEAPAEVEREELRSCVALVLSPFSPLTKSKSGGYPSVGGGGGGSAAAAAAAVSYQADAWTDVLALMGCIGPWARRTTLTEVLQLALVAACRERTTAGTALTTADRSFPWPRLLPPVSASTLRLLEFQGLPGVRKALPYAWAASAAGAVRDLASEVRRLTAALGGTAGVQPEGGRPSKKAKKSDGSMPAAGDDSGGGAAAAACEKRLDMLLDADTDAESSSAAEGFDSKVSTKAVRRCMTKQIEAFEIVTTGFDKLCGSGSERGGSPDAAAGGGGVPAPVTRVAASAASLQSILAFLYDRMYLDLIPRKARGELARQVAAAAAIVLDLLILARYRPASSAAAAPSDQHQLQQLQLQLLPARCELLAVALGCLRAWHRLATAYGSERDGGGDGDEGGGDDDGGEFASLGGKWAGATGAGGVAGDVDTDPRVKWLVGAFRLLAAEAEAADRDAAAAVCDPAVPSRQPSPYWVRQRPLLSLEVAYCSGQLLTALLAAAMGGGAGGAAPAETPESVTRKKGKSRGGQVHPGGWDVPTGLLLAHSLLKQAKAKAAKAAKAAAAASTTSPAERALFCRLGLAATEAAAATAAAAATPGVYDLGAARKALARVGSLSTKLLTSPGIGASADAAAAAAAAPPPPNQTPSLDAVLAVRAGLCLVGCQGRLLQLSAAVAAGAGAGAASPGAAADGGACAVTVRKTATGALTGEHMPLRCDGLTDTLLRAAGWVAAERGLYSTLTALSRRGESHAAAAPPPATVATEPLEHCLSYMYGISQWLPVLGRSGGGARAGDDADEAEEETAAAAASAYDVSAGGSSASDDALALLVAVQQALLVCTAAPERPCRARTSNMWAVLLADLDPEGAGFLSRRGLLECFRSTLWRCNRGQLGALLRGLMSRLRPEGLVEPGPEQPQQPQQQTPQPLFPLLHCLLISLECLNGPRATRLLAAQGPAIVTTLTELLAALAARAAMGESGGAATSPEVGGGGGARRGEEEVEVVACCAMRCLQSVAAREVTFRLAAPAVTGVLSAVVAVASCPLLRPTLAHGSDLYFLHASCCGLVAAVVRHHEGVVRHCAALVVSACRELLLRLAAWASELRAAQRQLQLQLRASPAASASAAAATAVAASVDGLERCAAALARVYEAASEHPKTLGKYAPHILADYIVHVATPLPSLALLMHADDTDPWVINVSAAAAVAAAAGPVADSAAQAGDVGAGGMGGFGPAIEASGGGPAGVGATLLPQGAHEALRQGAYSLMACLGPPQLQHLHMALGAGDAAAGSAGAARRAALAQLRKEYDSSFKYTGKV